jgi:hypothetical protein
MRNEGCENRYTGQSIYLKQKVDLILLIGFISEWGTISLKGQNVTIICLGDEGPYFMDCCCKDEG